MGEWENGRMGDGTTPLLFPGKMDSSEGSEVLDGTMIKAPVDQYAAIQS